VVYVFLFLCVQCNRGNVSRVFRFFVMAFLHFLQVRSPPKRQIPWRKDLPIEDSI